MHRNKKFCSNKCKFKYFKKYEISAFYNPKIQIKNAKKIHKLYPNLASECGKKSAKTNKKNKTSMYYDKKLQSKFGKIGGKKAAITNRKNNTGSYHDLKIRKKLNKKAAETNKKNKTSFCFDKKLQSKGGKIGGVNAQKTIRKNYRNLFFKGQYYDSKLEMDISICFQKQFNYIPKEGKTLHIRIGRFEYDYLLKKLKLFIEYHAWDRKYTFKEYYDRRRKVLNQNGYKNYKLIVIK